MRAPSRSTWRTAVSCVSLAVFAMLARPASAQGLGGVTFSSFSSDIELQADGSFDVREEVVGTFTEPRHGLFRFIPVEHRRPDGTVKRIRLRVDAVRRDGERVPFETHRSGAYEVIKVGDPDVTFVGGFRYDLVYHVDDAVLFHDLEDELYWNVTGDAWDAPLGAVRASVLVRDVNRADLQADCFQGPAGSVERCQAEIDHGVVLATASGPMTVSVRFPKNVTREPSTQARLRWWLADHWDLFSPILPALTLAILFHRWWHHGRDPRRTRAVVAQYGPPSDLRPAELATLVDARVKPRAFAATLVDLAARGFVTVREEPGGGAFAGTGYVLARAKPDGDLASYERRLLDGVFGERTEAHVGGPDERLSAARRAFEDALYRRMAEEDLYVKNPRTARLMHAAIGIAAIGAGILLGAEAATMTGRPVVMASLLACGGLFLLFAPFMPKKTEKGAVLADLGLGFREYLSVAERYRAQWQEEQGIFEKLLPYAVAFGVADRWAAALAEKQASSPAWYAGTTGTWDARAFAGSMDGFVSALGTASAPASSGGGGGRGSSGGGFGGGGGGSW